MFKVDLGYKLVFQRKVKYFKNFFGHSNMQSSPFVSCYYCMRKRYIVRKCRIKKYDFPNDLVRWVLKGTINNSKPKLMRGPIPTTWICFVGIFDNQ